ncbi:MAG: hypothetical protein R3E95_12825 [Thiolinea sp.]
MVSTPYFLITKLEAFDGRGEGDFLLSHDIEDIVAVIDGRPELIEEVMQAESTLRQVLSRRFQALLNNERFLEALAGHLPSGAGVASVDKVLKVMRKIV